MEIKDLTEEIVTPIIRELVSEFGADYVYKEEEREIDDGIDCYYQQDGKPSCIVGHILDRAGVRYDPEWEGVGVESILRAEGLYALGFALGAAQYEQDNGHFWGQALKAYERRLRA